MMETRHTSEAARYLYGTSDGIVEFRAIPTTTTVVYCLVLHDPDCDGENCRDLDCEMETHGASDVWLGWQASGDEGVWAELSAYVVGLQLSELGADVLVEPSHEARDLRARLIAEGRFVEAAGYFDDDGGW